LFSYIIDQGSALFEQCTNFILGSSLRDEDNAPGCRCMLYTHDTPIIARGAAS